MENFASMVFNGQISCTVVSHSFTHNSAEGFTCIESHHHMLEGSLWDHRLTGIQNMHVPQSGTWALSHEKDISAGVSLLSSKCQTYCHHC